MTRILFLPDPNTLIWLEDDLSPDDLLKQIRAGSWLPPAPFHALLTGKINAACQDGVVTITRTNMQVVQAQPVPRLSLRQREVLKALVEGQTTRMIAHHLRLSRRMVHYHVSNLKRMFSARTRAELIANTRSIFFSGQDPTPDDQARLQS